MRKVAWILLVALGVGCSGRAARPAEQVVETEAPWASIRHDGLGVELEMPPAWETNDANGLLVINPLPPEDDVFVFVVDGADLVGARARLGLANVKSAASGAPAAATFEPLGGEVLVWERVAQQGTRAVSVIAVTAAGAGRLETAARVMRSVRISLREAKKVFGAERAPQGEYEER